MSATILVLEDDDNLRAEVGETLEDADHRVTLCASPTEAIAAAKKQPFDLFLTDVRMAGEIDGVGALAVIKQIQPKIRSIIMTGYADLEVPPKAASLQADDYLLKGDHDFGIATLLNAVSRALNLEDTPEPIPENLFKKLYSLFSPKEKTQAPPPLLSSQELLSARQACWQYFFITVRSGHISIDDAFSYWSALEAEEFKDWSKRSLAPYKNLFSGHPNYSQTTSKIGIPQVKTLLKRVRDGQISGDEFLQSCEFATNPDLRRRSFQDFCTHQRLWGEQVESEKDLLSLQGQTIDGYRIGSCCQSGAGAALYFAEKDGLTYNLFVCQNQDGAKFPDTQVWRNLRYRLEIGRTHLLRRQLLRLPPTSIWKLFRPLIEAIAKRPHLSSDDAYIFEIDISHHQDLGLSWNGTSSRAKYAFDTMMQATNDRKRCFLGIFDFFMLPLLSAASIHSDIQKTIFCLGVAMLRHIAQDSNVIGRDLSDSDSSYDGCWSLWVQPMLSRMLITDNADPNAFRSYSALIAAWDSQLEFSRQIPLSQAYKDEASKPWTALDWLVPLAFFLEEQHQSGKAFGYLSPQQILFSRGGISISTNEKSLNFAAPEVKQGHPPTSASDIYSWTLLLGALLIPKSQRAAFLDGDLTALPPAIPKQCLMALDADPAQRPTNFKSYLEGLHRQLPLLTKESQ